MIDADKEGMADFVYKRDGSSRQRAIRECANLVRKITARLIHPRLATAALTDLQRCLAAALDAACLDDDGVPMPVPPSEIHPWVGQSNVVAPPMQLHLEEDVLVGIVECSEVYGGHVPWVHGGVVAGLFDAMVATRGALSGSKMTAKLVIGYRNPVPLNRPLRLEAVVDRIDGRK